MTVNEGGNTEILVAIAQLDGKLSLSLAEIAAMKASDADHEGRLRTIENAPVPDKKTADRLEALEQRRTISPAQLWAGLVGVAGFIGTVLVIVNQTTSLLGG